MTLDYDKLNQLEETEIEEIKTKISKMKSKPYEEYFGEMGITDQQKEERIELAEKLEKEMLFVLSLIAVLSQYSVVDWEDIETQFETAYFNVLGGRDNLDSYTLNYIAKTSQTLTECSELNEGTEYNTSYDRAMYISENDANAIMNHEEDIEALEAGYTYKTWHTMRDKKVRDVHAKLDGETIPIEELFLVGNSIMSYPMDMTYDPDPEDYIGCRCWITYS